MAISIALISPALVHSSIYVIHISQLGYNNKPESLNIVGLFTSPLRNSAYAGNGKYTL